MIEHDDLKRELKKAQKRAKEAERKLDDLAIAAELIEEESSSTIAFKHDIVEPALEGLDLTELVKAVAEADVDSLLTAHGNLRSNAISLARWADDLLDSEDEQDSETDTSKDSSSDEIARQANDHLERRLRDLVYDLYEQALALPREMRLLYRKFSKERDNFQTQAREYEDVVHSLLHDQKIDARLSIVFTRVKRTYPAMDVDDVAQLNEILTQVRNAELKLDDIEKNLSLINSVILEQRCSYQDLANQVMNLRARADDIESLATMFGIPCPVEIARQIEETRARLLTLGGEDQSERLRSMMRFCSDAPVRSKSLQRMIANRVEASALMLTVNPNPRSLFSDVVDLQTALSRLFILMSLCSTEDKGLGFNTMLKIMHLSNLVPDSDQGILEAVLETLKGDMYSEKPYKRGKVLVPTEACKQATKTILPFIKDKDAVLSVIERARKLHWAKWREKRYGSKG